MWAYTLRRLLYAVPVLLGVSMLVFALIHLAPGDVVDILVPAEVPKEIADSLRRRFRLDEPLYMQYLAWLSRLLVGDFGISFFTNRPVAEELFGALGNTLVLALPAAVGTALIETTSKSPLLGMDARPHPIRRRTQQQEPALWLA